MGITFEAPEEGTLLATLSFKDSLGNSFTPDTSFWQLTKKSDGSVVNNRSFANGTFSGTQVVMSGDDLAIDSDGDVERIFAVQGTYTSSYGNGLPFTLEEEFKIKNKHSQPSS